VLEGIVKDGQVVRGWIGVEPTEITADLAKTFNVQRDNGVIITGVLQNGPAFKAGIKPGDVLVSVQGQPIQTVAELLARVSALKPGQAAQMTVLRQADQIDVMVVPGQRPKAKTSPR
jgi:S1-C subfamily serine protease